MKLIKVEPRPVKQAPVAQHPADQCLVEQRGPIDVQVAEAAGFHRAMDIWSEVLRYGACNGAQENLRCQATLLASLLAPYNIEDPSSLPGKFKHFQTLRCPNRVIQAADPSRLVPQASYYDEFLNILDRRQEDLS